MSIKNFLTSKTFFIQLAIAFAIIVVSAFLLMNFLSFKTNHGEEMAVPDLSKMQFSIAEEKLAEMGLEIVLLDTVDFKDEMPPFSIVEQDPKAGNMVKDGRKIYVKLNAGEYNEVTLPEFKDKISPKYYKYRTTRFYRLCITSKKIPPFCKDLLKEMNPYLYGGEMIKEVFLDKVTFNELPYKFEAGTPNIAGGIVLGTAIDYMNNIGFDAIAKYEKELLDYGTKRLLEIEGLKIYGTSKNKTSVISFNIEGIHPYDIGTIIDKLGIAVRTGHHCAQPIMSYYNVPGTIRASFAFYNTKEEIDIFVEAVKKAQMMLS